MILPGAKVYLLTAGAAVTLEKCTPAQRGQRCCTEQHALAGLLRGRGLLGAIGSLLLWPAVAACCRILVLAAYSFKIIIEERVEEPIDEIVVGRIEETYGEIIVRGRHSRLCN